MNAILVLLLLAAVWVGSGHAQERRDLTQYRVTAKMPLPQHMPPKIDPNMAARLQRMLQHPHPTQQQVQPH